MPDAAFQSATTEAIEHLLDPTLVRATVKRMRPDRALETVTLRPVLIKGVRQVQVSRYDGRKTQVRNVATDGLRGEVDELFGGSLKSISVGLADRELLIQFSRKGRPVVHRRQRSQPIEPDLDHDRTIERPLPEGEPDPLLQAIGLMTAEGRVKADRRRKFVQINEFIRIVLETVDLGADGHTWLIADYGCGNAYLSFALHHYLTAKRGLSVELVGVDRNAELIERNRGIAAELGAPGIRFDVGDIGAHSLERDPDIVTALHACDTATDAALAQALHRRARYIFAAPCCHHHLQAQAGFLAAEGALRPILDDAILRERLGDLVTDELRALILRIAGYHVDVIEFTAPEHTAKNLLLRAKPARHTDVATLGADYRRLKAEFSAEPYLESLAPDSIRASLR